jgi:23S rRNA (cytosine1962-C5)-methyltransferase
MARVILKFRKARPFWFGHPWVFTGAIDRVKGQVADGDVVELVDDSGRLIGEGFWNSKSQIAVRLTSLKGEGALDTPLLLKRLDAAIALREDTLRLSECTNAYRVVHSEGDGLPGLIVDRLGPYLMLQVSCFGMARFLEPLLQRLIERYQPEAVCERECKVAVEEEGLVRPAAVLHGTAPTGPVEVREFGVKAFADPMGGQKTGWYSDQRDNRHFAAHLARNKDVLDAFSYTGGFALQMAAQGARHVTLVDSSEPAIDLARRAAEAQAFADRMSFERGNVLRVFDHFAQEGRQFDVVVIDPPKFVHKRAELERGLALYHEVNVKALRLVRDGGVLMTHSCSQHVAEEHFDEMLASAAKSIGVRAQEFFRSTQAPDHPVLIPLLESRYLKCRAVRVHATGMDLTIAPRGQEGSTRDLNAPGV